MRHSFPATTSTVRPGVTLPAGGSLTVLLNTFQRPNLLRQSVAHFTACAAVARVHVNWAESLRPPDLSADVERGTPVTFALPLATHNDSSLNTRFLPVDGALLVSCRLVRGIAHVLGYLLTPMLSKLRGGHCSNTAFNRADLDPDKICENVYVAKMHTCRSGMRCRFGD